MWVRDPPVPLLLNAAPERSHVNREEQLLSVVLAFLDSKAGENEHGVFFQTSKLRAAYKAAEEVMASEG